MSRVADTSSGLSTEWGISYQLPATSSEGVSRGMWLVQAS